MAGNKHVEWFTKTHMRPDEQVVASAAGHIDKPAFKRGALIVTTQRVAFYSKGWFGEHLEHFELSRVNAVARSSGLLGAKATISASGAELQVSFAYAPEAIAAVYQALDVGRQKAA
jgi:hypothetical protein